MRGFGAQARKQQERFRDSSPTVSEEGRSPTDDKGSRNGHLLAVNHEEENLYPAIRGPEGARAFLQARGVHWWRSSRSGDNTNENGPTRNMASSQIACINFLLPLVQAPEALVAILREIDDDVREVEALTYTPRGAEQAVSSPVEFEWVGLDSCLEGGPGTRGANTTSVDALMVGITETGVRRAYLFEWKYVEQYKNAEFLGEGKSGETRRQRYADLYAGPESRFNGNVPLDELLYEPFYQIMRLCLLADKMVRDQEFGIAEAKVVVVCPEGNDDYRNTITSPALEKRVPHLATVAAVVHAALRNPSDFAITSPEALVEAVHRCVASNGLADWLSYHHERYG